METATFRIWTEASQPPSQFELERNHDDFHCLSSVVLPQFQNLLPRKGAGQLGSGVSRTRQLSALHRMGSRHVSADVRILRSCFGKCSGISFMDSTCIKVCHNRQIKQHKVFEDLAARGKTSGDWFFGFKLHLVVNDRGELLNIILTPGNTVRVALVRST